jgi:RNA polymerase sigma factor (sigma-70 family)
LAYRALLDDVAESLELPDANLIRRFLDGDERAFRLLYDRHTPRLKMTLQRLLGVRREEADDMVQDTWLAGCRGLHGFRGEARFSTWLTSIGVSLTINHLTRRPHVELQIVSDIAAPAGLGPAATIDLERALAGLPDHQRIVVVLHDVEGFTHDEIAEQLGMAAGTSKATLSRARQALRAVLGGEVSNVC